MLLATGKRIVCCSRLVAALVGSATVHAEQLTAAQM